MWLEKEQLDKLMYRKPRTYQNCAGYAFGIDGWYDFGDNEEENYKKFCPHRKKNGEPWRDWERRCVRRLLRDFPGWKLVNNKLIDNVDIDPAKYHIVALRMKRVYVFNDFHFMRCEENGDWTEKHGADPRILRHRYEEIYDVWGDYNGKIYFFIKPRKEASPKKQVNKKFAPMTRINYFTNYVYEPKTEHVPFYRNV